MNTIYERLNLIKEEITNEKFRRSKGLGNEIGYYVFDYEPKHEELVREHISFLKKKFNDCGDFYIREFDLYEIIIEILMNEGYLEDSFRIEREEGPQALLEALKALLQIATEQDLVVSYIKEHTQENDIVFITGVGKVWPVIRSHSILNRLHSKVDKVPVVMFFPGVYDGKELMLFGEFKDYNYYRAFKL